MKIVKSILAAVAVILVIAFTGIYFLPDTTTMSYSIEIDRPMAQVYPQLADFNNWNKWNGWKDRQPGLQLQVENLAGAIGHKGAWSGGAEVGACSMCVSQLQADTLIEQDLYFTQPISGKAKSEIHLSDLGGGKTKVSWTTRAQLPYPIGRLWGLTLPQMVGQVQAKGLENLKSVCERMP